MSSQVVPSMGPLFLSVDAAALPSDGAALNGSVGSLHPSACEAIDRSDDAFLLAVVVLVFLATVSDVVSRRAR